MALKTFALLILLAEIALNSFGYGLAYLTQYILRQKETFLPLLFLVGSKEIGIASAAVEIMKLNNSVVIPSGFYAVVQMITLPIMVKILNRSSRRRIEVYQYTS
jgi:BASS family bile acid:Na+ symporter